MLSGLSASVYNSWCSALREAAWTTPLQRCQVTKFLCRTDVAAKHVWQSVFNCCWGCCSDSVQAIYCSLAYGRLVICWCLGSWAEFYWSINRLSVTGKRSDVEVQSKSAQNLSLKSTAAIASLNCCPISSSVLNGFCGRVCSILKACLLMQFTGRYIKSIEATTWNRQCWASGFFIDWRKAWRTKVCKSGLL